MKINFNGSLDFQNKPDPEPHEIDLSSFTNIIIDLYAFSIDIHSGTNYHVTICGNDKDYVTAEVKEQTLFIREKGHNSHSFTFNYSFKINKIIVTIPEDAPLNTLQANEHAGSVFLSDLNMQQFKLKNEAGSTKLLNVTITEDAKLNLETGSLSINNCNINLKAKLSAGSVKIDNLQGKSQFILSSGSFKMIDDNNTNIGYDLSADVGTIYFHGNREGRSFYCPGDDQNQVTVQCGAGSIKIV
ncbi:DUF4097 family beta strand repeat-containing protein [Lactobacillus rizhaonensis]|uniref:DUF4097 family beta strand repeat-containing protein n=1 Tax=Lactobacillus rizhaonensis TaxID=3082863 RepID=UPI0030C6ACC4